MRKNQNFVKNEMVHYIKKHVAPEWKHKGGCSYFLTKRQARRVTLLTLQYGTIKCHSIKTKDSLSLPVVKIENIFSIQ